MTIPTVETPRHGRWPSPQWLLALHQRPEHSAEFRAINRGPGTRCARRPRPGSLLVCYGHLGRGGRDRAGSAGMTLGRGRWSTVALPRGRTRQKRVDRGCAPPVRESSFAEILLVLLERERAGRGEGVRHLGSVLDGMRGSLRKNLELHARTYPTLRGRVEASRAAQAGNSCRSRATGRRSHLSGQTWESLKRRGCALEAPHRRLFLFHLR